MFGCESKGETCLLFFTDVWDFFSLGHQTKLRPVFSLVMSKKDDKETRCPVDIWHFLFFVPYAVLHMLASLCLSAIFNNQAIMMPSWFRQWYLLRSSHQRWNWMTGWLQPGGYVLYFKKGQSGYNPITLLSHDWAVNCTLSCGSWCVFHPVFAVATAKAWL